MKSNRESIIKWKVGTPEQAGTYLVTIEYCYMDDLNTKDKYYNTSVVLAYWDEFWHEFDDPDSDCRITAWCKTSDIKPYEILDRR